MLEEFGVLGGFEVAVLHEFLAEPEADLEDGEFLLGVEYAAGSPLIFVEQLVDLLEQLGDLVDGLDD